MQTRRTFLTRSAALGCSAAASPLCTPVTLATAPGDARLVVIVLRGGMDGLDTVRPVGDPAYAGFRPTLNSTPGPALTDFYAAHPGLAPLMPLWRAGELSFAHAVSTPYRNKRSHFDGQDFLENGGAEFTAARLVEDSRIAAFSIAGWDSHRDQARVLSRALGELTEAILVLKEGLGTHWGRTCVMAITEFGRTVRENGSKGTDHGTGGVALFAGGAIRGGSVMGRWPGLGQGDLYEDRDLMPVGDVRALAGWALRGLFGLERTALETEIFPGLDLGGDPRLLA